MSDPEKSIDTFRDEYIITDPKNTYIDSTVKLGKGCVVEPFSFLKGNTVVGDYSKIGPSSYIENVKIGKNCNIKYSTCVNSNIESDVEIGPYSRVRDNTYIGKHVYIGNYVEIKNSAIKDHSQISHFSYIGDAKIGSHVNIGAGTVTCNYDGTNKNTTVVSNNCFVGSGTMLIAPVKIGANVVIGAGSVVTKDVKENITVTGNPARELKKENI